MFCQYWFSVFDKDFKYAKIDPQFSVVNL